MKLLILSDGTNRFTRIQDEDGVFIVNARVVTTRIKADEQGWQSTITLFRKPPTAPLEWTDEGGTRWRWITEEEIATDPITQVEIHTRIQYPRISFGIGHARREHPNDWQDAFGAALDANTAALRTHTDILIEQPL